MGDDGPATVTIVDRRGPDHWEVAAIRGALWGRGVRSRVVTPGSRGRDHPLVVILPGEPDPVMVSAGFQLTLAYLGWAGGMVPAPVAASPHGVCVVGEPYEAIARLATDPCFLEAALGRTMVGQVLDTRFYRTPPPERKAHGETHGGAHHGAPVLTSLGCLKRCGYCSQGSAYARLYPGGAPRRPRPWPGLLEDLLTLTEDGVTRFRLVADQFLSPEPRENEDLAELTRRWAPVRRGAGLSFTVAPRELLANRGLLEAMAAVFTLYPRLSIDSFSDETLRLLDLDFDASSALQAARLLGSLGLPFRINYIFIRPGMTMGGLREELEAIRQLVVYTQHLSYSSQLLLTHDLFSHRLDVLSGSPVAVKGLPADYERQLPREVLTTVAAIAEAVAALVDEASAGSEVGRDGPTQPHPLEVAVNAGQRAAGPLGRHPGRAHGCA